MKHRFRKRSDVVFLFFVFTMLYTSQLVYAAGEPIIISGTINLFNAAKGWINLLIPVCGGVFVGFHSWQKSMSDDESMIAKHNKMIKNTIIGCIMAMAAVNLISFVLSFYGGTTV